jgi:hypothetical protein
VSDPASLELVLFRELMLQLVRAGTITDDMISNVERQFEAEARQHQGSDRGERYEQLAHMARVLPIEAAALSASDFYAGQRRKQLHVITPDGGNDQT